MVSNRSPRRSSRQASRKATLPALVTSSHLSRRSSSLSSLSASSSSSPDPLAPTPKKEMPIVDAQLRNGCEMGEGPAGMSEETNDRLVDGGPRGAKRRKISENFANDVEDLTQASSPTDIPTRITRSTAEQSKSPSIDVSTKRRRTRSSNARFITTTHLVSHSASPPRSTTGGPKRLISLNPPKLHESSLPLKMMDHPAAERETAKEPPLLINISSPRVAGPTSSARFSPPGSSRYMRAQNLAPVLAGDEMNSPPHPLYSPAVSPPSTLPLQGGENRDAVVMDGTDGVVEGDDVIANTGLVSKDEAEDASMVHRQQMTGPAGHIPAGVWMGEEMMVDEMIQDGIPKVPPPLAMLGGTSQEMLLTRPSHDSNRLATPRRPQPPPHRPPRDPTPRRQKHLQKDHAEEKTTGEGSVPAPMRARRSGQLNGGQNKMFEIMIVECFERAYEALRHPPASLPIVITTAAFDRSGRTLPTPSWWTETPASMHPEASQIRKNGKFKDPIIGPMITIRAMGGDGTVTLPSWRMVNESDDIAESTGKGGRTTRGGARGGDDNLSEPEDMTDEYYEKMHHRFERVEVQARLREREMLQSERYHLKQRLDLLRSMAPQLWVNHVTRIIEANGPTPFGHPDSQAESANPSAATKRNGAVWLEAAEKMLKELGMEGVRNRLIVEGVELLNKYDSFLPQRLRDVVSTPRAGSHVSDGVEPSRAESWDTRSRKSTPRSDVQQAAPKSNGKITRRRSIEDHPQSVHTLDAPTPASQPRAKRKPPSRLALGAQPSDQIPAPGEVPASSTMSTFEPYVSITTESGKPVLQEAADRRLQLMLLTEGQVGKKGIVEDRPRGRANARSALIHPFGVPISGQAAKKDPFDLDGPVWIPFIQQRMQGKGWSVVMDSTNGLRIVKTPAVSSTSSAVVPVQNSDVHSEGIVLIHGQAVATMSSVSASIPAAETSSGSALSPYQPTPIPSQPLQVQPLIRPFHHAR